MDADSESRQGVLATASANLAIVKYTLDVAILNYDYMKIVVFL